MSDEITAETDPQKEADAAFHAAIEGYHLDDKPLRNYSRTRSRAARVMGLRYPFVGADGLAQFKETNFYPHALNDLTIVLWLCSIPDAYEISEAHRKKDQALISSLGAWSPEKAFSQPKEALDAAYEWGEENKLSDEHVNSERFQKAFAMVLAIIDRTEASKFYVKIEGGGGDASSGKV